MTKRNKCAFKLVAIMILNTYMNLKIHLFVIHLISIVYNTLIDLYINVFLIFYQSPQYRPNIGLIGLIYILMYLHIIFYSYRSNYTLFKSTRGIERRSILNNLHIKSVKLCLRQYTYMHTIQPNSTVYTRAKPAKLSRMQFFLNTQNCKY